MESTGEDIFGDGGEVDVRCSHPSPTAGHRKEDVRQLGDELGLDFLCQHQVAVAVLLRGEGGKDPAADAEIGCTEVGAFLHAGQTKCQTAKVGRRHGKATLSTVV